MSNLEAREMCNLCKTTTPDPNCQCMRGKARKDQGPKVDYIGAILGYVRGELEAGNVDLENYAALPECLDAAERQHAQEAR